MSGILYFTLDATLREDTPTRVIDWIQSSGDGTSSTPPDDLALPAREMVDEAAWLFGLPEVVVRMETGRLRVAGHVRLRHDGYELGAVYGAGFALAPYVDHELIGMMWSDFGGWPELFLAQGRLPYLCDWGAAPIPVEHDTPWREDA